MRRPILLVVGAIMIGLGILLALRPLLARGRPITASPWLDMAFAAFFLFRGIHNLRVARRTASPPADPGPRPPEP